jgi:hypothetical protein
MKHPTFSSYFTATLCSSIFLILSCTSSTGDKNPKQMKTSPAKGSYGFDIDFFAKRNINTVELKDPHSNAGVLIIPAYQGRVMTSTADGNEGPSFGWINYKHIESGKLSSQFNPFGGEERLWLGPEGGPFSIYFKKDTEQVFSNWVVPKEIDTDEFIIVAQSEESVSFHKDFTLTNASGTTMNIGIDRGIRILGREEAEASLGLKMGDSLTFVAYQSENTLINNGQSAWTEKTGVYPSGCWLCSIPLPKELCSSLLKPDQRANSEK